MATFSAILVPSSPVAATLFTGTAGAATTITTGFKTIIGVELASATAGTFMNVRFGSALKAPTATISDWAIIANTAPQLFDLGEEFDRVSVYGSGGTYWIYVFSPR
jgi:hypothetical protein